MISNIVLGDGCRSRLTVLVCATLISACTGGAAVRSSDQADFRSAKQTIDKARDQIAESAKPVEASTETKADDSKTAPKPPPVCQFRNGKWNEEFRVKPYVYHGNCNDKGFAEGFGGIFLKQTADKPVPKQFSYGPGREFALYVGAFQDGQPNGEGILTAEARVVDLYDELELINPEITEAQYVDERRRSAGAKMLGDLAEAALKSSYESDRRKAREVLAGYAQLIRIPSYVGSFKAGAPDGKGIQFNGNYKIVYSGEWRAGRKAGYGRMFLPAYFQINQGMRKSNAPLRLLAAEGFFENERLTGVATALYSRCRVITGHFVAGEFRPGVAVVEKRKFLDTEKSTRHTLVRTSRGVQNTVEFRPFYDYAWKYSGLVSKDLEPVRKGNFTRSEEDDLEFRDISGRYDNRGRLHGAVTTTHRTKKLGDLTNRKEVPIYSNERVTIEEYVNGKRQPRKPQQKAISIADLVELYVKAIEARNPGKVKKEIVEGMIYGTIGFAKLLTNDPCSDLGDIDTDLPTKYEGVKLTLELIKQGLGAPEVSEETPKQTETKPAARKRR